MTLISVIVPAYNAESTLAETLSSVVSQSHRECEILVIDDGSTDATTAIACEFAARDARVRLERQGNSGVAAARNTGVRLARGEFIAPIDADDLWHPDKLARQLRRLQAASPTAGMVYCWSTDIDTASRIVYHRLAAPRWEGDIYAALVWSNFIGNGSVPLIRRALVEAVGGWDPALRAAHAQGCEDWQLYLRIAERADVVLEPAFLVGYRQGSAAMSRDIDQMRRSYTLIMDEAHTKHPELPRQVFRWSRGAFDLYSAELAFDARLTGTGLRAGAAGVLKDPAWLLRRSSLHKLLGIVAAPWRSRGRGEGRVVSSLPYPIGLPFDILDPEPHRARTEGVALERRERKVAGWRARRISD